MATEYFYHTPFLGRLMDPANFPTPPDLEPRPPYKDNILGQSAVNARKAGLNVSGRVLNIMTSLSHAATRDPINGKLSLRMRRGLAATYRSVQALSERTDWEVLNIAWHGEIETRGSFGEPLLEPFSDSERAHMTAELDAVTGFQNLPVWLPQPASKWRRFAEHVLWPTFHYMQNINPDTVDTQKSDFQSYKQFNQAYADVILAVYQPGDVIWIHDYYLMLLPQMLRDRLPDAKIGFFMHLPFPSSEFIRDIPQRSELMWGILGATLVAVQSPSYVRHLISSCIRLLGNEHSGDDVFVDGRAVSCQSLPVGIDVQQLVRESKEPSMKELVAALKTRYSGKKIIIGRDKFDNMLGVIQKLKAFGLFLAAHPEWREKVVLVQITTPAYDHSSKLEAKVSEIVAELNGLFGTMQSWPIQHYSRHVAHEEYLGLLQAADLGVFIGGRDSTSHAALEYVCCQNENHKPVIVSEFMGVTDYLRDALVVNPYDPMSVAQIIYEGLTQNFSSRLSFQTLLRYDISSWLRTFIGNLLQHDLSHESKHHTPELNIKDVTAVYKAATKRLFLFDYDGTLTPIVSDPAAALPSERLKKIMHKLASDPANDMWVISGRDQKFLDEQLGEFGLSMSAEHGSFVKHKGDKEWTDLAAQLDNSWQKVVLEVLQAYTERTQGSVIEQKKASITWHYRRADPVFGEFQASHLRAYLEVAVADSYPVAVMSGKANVEVRPHLFHKGVIVRNIFKDEGEIPDFVFVVGDDTTDEDMFNAVNERRHPEQYFSVVVGPPDKLTVAHTHVQNPNMVHNVLEALANSTD